MPSCPFVPLSPSMREPNETADEEEFDLWKIDRNSAEETHQAEFVLK